MSDALIDERIAPVRANKGLWAWVLVFGSVLLPVVAPVVFFIAEVFGYNWYRKKQDVGAVNSRNATNWVFSYALFSIAAALLVVVVANVAYYVHGIALIMGVLAWLGVGAWVVVSGMTLYYAIVGIIAAVDGRSYDVRWAVRVVRGERVWAVDDATPPRRF